MNSTLKSFLWIAVAAVTLVAGLRFQKDREIAERQKDLDSALARAAELGRETSMVRAKLELAQAQSTAGADFEAKHSASVAASNAALKRIDELVAKWPALEADRAAAVAAVRKQESTRAPYRLAMSDGTALENFVFRSMPDENTLSVEHANGLVKMKADLFPAELRARLGVGWKPEPPTSFRVDKDGNPVPQKGAVDPENQSAAEAVSQELGLAKADTSTMDGISKALAVVEAQLVKTQAAFEAERANIRKLEIFKSNLTAPGTGKTYAAAKKDAFARLADLAGRVQALRAEKNNLLYKMKSL